MSKEAKQEFLKMTQEIFDFIQMRRDRPYCLKQECEDLVLDEIGDEIYRLRMKYLADDEDMLKVVEEEGFPTEYGWRNK